MKILFIGGYGNISWYCTKKAIEQGHEIYLLNRSQTTGTRREIPKEVNVILSDVRDFEQTKIAIADYEFDVVCDFICYNEENARSAVELFANKTKQYVLISSDAVYERNSHYLPFKETTPFNDSETSCSYVAGKINAEKVFRAAQKELGLPLTIVRPSYTYDTIIPVSLGHNDYTAPARYIGGKPVLIAGEGNNLWTFTHSSDFANAFVGLLGLKEAIGEDFHIASDEWLTWNEAMAILLDELGVKAPTYLHVPLEDVMNSEFAEQKDLMFQKTWHNIHDNSKIKKFVPSWSAKVLFREGIRQTIAWFNENEKRKRISPNMNNALENLENKYTELTK